MVQARKDKEQRPGEEEDVAVIQNRLKASAQKKNLEQQKMFSELVAAEDLAAAVRGIAVAAISVKDKEEDPAIKSFM